ncbi:hypothetical protein N7462_004301 [Penicillium macrosclerotiorum]|uniref:uncharacterized protein n=1 Tax=Penicillium macrosclerotiorum TaxID=303699 RepID=UPI00254876F5|nr:uncharacterized protein N7462_004301 [Penicillium macrosclerotiorum]KAJ5689909.1 hypothetical protein N7462_004301 [Penicillium macrosclerotiorum]
MQTPLNKASAHEKGDEADDSPSPPRPPPNADRSYGDIGGIAMNLSSLSPPVPARSPPAGTQPSPTGLCISPSETALYTPRPPTLASGRASSDTAPHRPPLPQTTATATAAHTAPSTTAPRNCAMNRRTSTVVTTLRPGLVAPRLE